MRKRDQEDEREDERVETGPGSAGQSGDLQGLDDDAETSLLEEGQSFEAGVVAGIENAPVADDGGLKTREVPEDDVPAEYLEDEIGNGP